MLAHPLRLLHRLVPLPLGLAAGHSGRGRAVELWHAQQEVRALRQHQTAGSDHAKQQPPLA